MNTIQCPGLDGSNPLHFLASLGVMRITGFKNAATSMFWKRSSGKWIPCFTWDGDFDSMAKLLIASLNILGEGKKPSAFEEDGKAQNEPTQKQIKEADASWKSERKTLLESTKKELKAKGEKDASRKAEEEVDKSKKIIELKKKVDDLREARDKARVTSSDRLGVGIAHLGDVIGMPQSSIRKKFYEAAKIWDKDATSSVLGQNDRFLLDQYASLGSDALSRNGQTVPTPFSFSNGQGGQCLLKNFRDSALKSKDPEAVKRCLTGKSIFSNDLTSLNWEPSDRNDYALAWANPGDQKNKKPVDFVTNALAYVGLGMLTVVPNAHNTLNAVCWENVDGLIGFIWPIWQFPLTHDLCRHMLSQTQNWLYNYRNRGISELMFSERIEVGDPPQTRYYFSPSRSL